MSGPALDVLCGFYFYPRGGSAHVVRSLCRHVPPERARLRLLTGTLGARDTISHARSFFAGVSDVRTVDYTAAVTAFRRGCDPLLAPVPMHAGYENQHAVPDRSFASAGPAVLAHQERFWAGRLADAGVRRADVVHLHHLTPQLGPALASGRPVIVHLHGTELKFLAGGEHGGGHTPLWLEHFRTHAPKAARLVAVSTDDAACAVEVLGVDPGAVEVIPNGVDADEFDGRSLTPAERRECWRRLLVTEPLGWDESGVPGSVRYDDATIDRLFPVDGSRRVVLCMTRFLSFKRVSMLLRSFARLQPTIPSATLVVLGGYPGEWEGEHPVTLARRLRLDNVVFPGFRTMPDVAAALAATDVLVNTSAHEPFGLAMLQAMAARVPVVAAAAGGPAMFVTTAPREANGWLFQPHDPSSLDRTLANALSSTAELRRRGANARAVVADRYSWSRVAERVADLYADVALTTAPLRARPSR